MKRNAFALSAAIGALAGLRAFTPLAVASHAARHNLLGLRRSPLRALRNAKATNVLAVLAAGELIGDKLPSTPSRLGAGPLIARIASGAICGAAISTTRSRALVTRNRGSAAGVGALMGGLGALAGALAGFHLRKHLSRDHKIPDAAIGVVEDGIAIAGSFAVARRSASLLSVATAGVL
jgi:uncharacterized membrane protein